MDRAFGLDIPETLDEACTPRRTAVIVYDMQVGIVSQIPAGREITDRVAAVLEAARSGGYRVVFTRHVSLPNEMSGVSQLRTAKAWQRAARAVDTKPPFLPDAAATQIVPELEPRPSEAVIDKITMSAFVGTALDLVLRDCGIDSFVLMGIALEVGIEPTARHALDLGYLPILVTDACGWRDAAAAERAWAQLAFAGGSLTADSRTIISLLRPGDTASDSRSQ
jgi:nicotinamidase-related amidase